MPDTTGQGYVTLRLPREDWNEIVRNLEKMCERERREIEILSDVTEVGDLRAENERLTEEFIRLTERNADNQIRRDHARDDVDRLRARIRAVIDDVE